MSNNSIYVDTYDKILPEVWDGYNGNGEPYGLINLRNAQRYGRLGDKRRDNCEGFNPCAEIGLADYECCNLSELYLNNIVSRDELVDLAKLIYKTQKAVCMLPFLHKPTQKIVRKNMRIGLGVTGVCQALDKLEWLDDAYKALREFDVTWSKLRGWNVSIKLTTVKPSGTLSLLAGSTPGVHPGYSPFYIRRVRMSSSDALVPTCRDLGYHVEYVLKFDGSEDRDTVVVSFPCEAGDSALVARDMTAIRQLELVKKLQTVWADNAVSVTVYYKKEELPEIKEWLKANLEESIKSVSFLLHSAHGFKQAPYEEIDYDTYMVMSSQVKPLTQFKGTVSDMLDMAECAGGACPIR
jgi:ribonucleoside-triphosphate reductase